MDRAREELDPDKDCFKPPAVPTLVHCIHCNQEYESYLIRWEVFTDPDGSRHGFWCCGMDGCDGKGFGFDIFPVDPDYVGEDGEKMFFYDDEEGDFDDEELDDDFDPSMEDSAPPANGEVKDDGEDLPW